jgi:hypothetical protein
MNARIGRVTLSLALLLLLASACSRRSAPTIEEESTIATPDAVDPVAGKLPANTLLYARVEGIANLEERVTATFAAALREPGPIRDKLHAAYADAVQALGRHNPLGLKEATVQRLIGDARSVHFAFVPPVPGKTRPEPQPVIFLHLGSAEAATAVLDDLKAGHKESGVAGARGCSLEKMTPFESIVAIDDRTLAIGANAVLEKVLAGPGGEALGSSASFQKAVSDLAGRGDVFAYVSIVAVKEEILREIDAESMPPAVKEKRRAAVTNAPFREVSTLAASVAVDGSFSVLAYTGAGQTFPDFLVRPATTKKLTTRIPADAAFTFACGYDGGKKTRKGFVDWLQEEAGRGGLDAVGMQRSVVGALTQNLDRLESDVVVKVKGVAEDLWLAALPVKSEMAITLAPDSAGRWGALMAFDIEDRAQAEKLAREIFVAGKGQGLPWKQTEHAGLVIHYLDIAEILKQKGTENLPKELVENVQLQIGYAMSDELFLAGSVELIKFAHRPSGRTLGDAMSVKGVDARNTLLWNVQPVPALQSVAKVPMLAESVQPILRQLPREASYTITLTIEKDRAALRSNVPLTALGAWGGMQFMDR